MAVLFTVDADGNISKKKKKKKALFTVDENGNITKNKEKEEKEEKVKKSSSNPFVQGMVQASMMPDSYAGTVGSLAGQFISDKISGGGYFQKGAFDKDVSTGEKVVRSVYGTSTDIGQDFVAGIVGMGEKAVDAAASLAPYALYSQGMSYDSPAAQFGAEAGRWIGGLLTGDKNANATYRKDLMNRVAEAERELDEFAEKDLYDEQAVANKIVAGVSSAWENAQKIQSGAFLTPEDLEQQRQQYDLALGYIENEMESDSVLGEKSDALVQSIAQLAAQYGLSYIGVPWYVTSGVTAYGGEYENALKQGATHGEAVGSGLITAGAEVLSEKLFSGDIFTKHAGADIATKYITTAISDKAMQKLAKAGLDVAGEGFEEVFSQFMSRLGSSLYKEEKVGEILFSEEALEEYLDSAIGGWVLGGGMTAINVATSKGNGADFVTGMQTDERAVIDKVHEALIAEEQSKSDPNKKMSAKKKAELWEKAVAAMDRGDINIEKIEEVLGGESYQVFSEELKKLAATEEYKAYRKAVQEEKKLRDEFTPLSKMVTEKMTGEQIYRRDELKKLLDESKVSELKAKISPEASRVFQLREKMRGEVMGRVGNTRLAESYAEFGRSKQKFTVDVNKYTDENARKTVQNILDSGLGDNTNKFHHTVDFLAKISADTGSVVFDLTNNERLGIEHTQEGYITNGYVSDDGKIVLNMDSPNALNTIVGHEITHTLEKAGVYKHLQQAAFDYAIAKEGLDKFNARLKEAEEAYKGKKNTTPEAEVTADLIGEYIFTDYDFVHNLSVNNRNVFQKIYDEIKYMFKIATAGSKEARELEKVKKLFDQAYRENVKGNAESKENVDVTIDPENDSDLDYESPVKYSVTVTDPETIDFLENQEHITTYKAMVLIDGKLYPPMASKVKGEDGKYHMTNPRELGEWQQAEEDTTNIKFNDKGVGYYDLKKDDGGTVRAAYNPYEHSSNLVLNDQFEAAYKRDNLVTVECVIPASEMASGYKAEHAKDSTGMMDWHSGVVAGKLSDSKRSVYLSRYLKAVRILPDAEVAQKYKEIVGDIAVPFNVVSPGLLTELENAGVNIDYDGSPQYQYLQRRAAEKEAKKTKYSVSKDSNGNQLTEDQVAFFANSKVRNEAGELIPVYHGTPNGSTTIFDKAKTSKINDMGQGIYFSTNKSDASEYMGKSHRRKLYSAYVNIEAPFVVSDDVKITVAEAVNLLKLCDDRYVASDVYTEIKINAKDGYITTSQLANTNISQHITEMLERSGKYDGIIDETVSAKFGLVEGTKHIVALYPSQIKNVDNENPTADADIRYSMSKADTEYMDAVNRGDTEAMQNIVDEAANAAGYTIKAYHGTGYDFTVFDKARQGNNYNDWGRLGKGFYFAPTSREAETWAELSKGSKNKVMPVYLRIENMLDSFEALPDNLKDTIPADWDSLTKRLAEKYAYNYIEYMQEFGHNVQQILIDKGYDGINGHTEFVVFNSEQVKSADPVTYDNAGNVIPLSERFKTSNEDIRYSLTKDSQGRDLSAEQVEFFQDSKVVDENGNLKAMYHGTPNGGFTVFKDGTYFTDDKEYADRYQNPGASSISTGKTASDPKTFEVYLNIKKPFDLNDAEARRIYIEEYIKGGNAVGINPYLSDAEYAKIKTIDWTEGEDLRDFLVDNGYDYDGLVLDEGADGGYGDAVQSRGTSWVVFSPEQVKNVDNKKPTADPDIRYSMSKVDKAKADKEYMDAVDKGDEETLKHLVGEYAKSAMPDSKLVDENGNLRVVYHGTNTGDFTVFNPDYIGMSSGDSGFFGMGFYFAYSKGEASYYGATRVIPAYLDLKNPFNFDRELQTYNGKKAQTGKAPDAVALMNFADKFPDIAMSITLDVSKEYGSVESISVFEFAKAFKDVIENKKFEYQEVENSYGETEILVTADPQVHEYEYNGETHSYRDFGFQKRWYGTPNELDVAYEYLSNSVYSYIDMPRRTNVILDNNEAFTSALKEMGYDGAIQSDYGDEAVAFEPSQIKSAAPITYDGEGKVIPLSKRFDRSNDDIRYSMSKVDEQVNAYEYNLEHGDTLGAEIAVEELANLVMPDSKIRGEDGRLIPLYHGTKEMFYEYDPTIGGGKNGTAEGFGIYLSDNQEVTKAYGDRQIKQFVNITKPATSFNKTITTNTLVKLIKDTCEKEAQRMVAEDGYDNIREALKDTWVSNYADTYGTSMDRVYREVAQSMLQQNDSDKDIIHEVMFGMAIRDYPSAMRFYRESLTPVTGFDGFITKWDNASTGETSNIYLAFDSSQLKSADAITYDDNGNVIPITERFNFDKKDIRYSMSKEGEEPNKYGDWHVYGKDFGNNDPLGEFEGVPITETAAESGPYEDNWQDAFDSITDEDVPPIPEDTSPAKEISTTAEKIKQKIKNTQAELDKNRELRQQSFKDYSEEIARLQEKYDSKRNKNSKVAQGLLRAIERMKRLQGNIDADYAKRISDLEARVEKMHSQEYQTAEHRRAKMEEHTKFWEDLIGDTSTWKDMSLGLSYKTKTLRRILRKVVRGVDGKTDFRLADDIYDELETKYDHNEALLKRESQRLKEVFFGLKLNNAEDTYAHMLGELRHNPSTELTEDVVKEYYDKHKKQINQEKVDKAIEESRKAFDELIGRLNEVLREQGFKEIPYRQGYFPHFTNPKQNWLHKLFNWKPVDNEIPTSIAGLTDQFKPQRSWQSFDKRREGDKTDYSLYQGLDTYIHGALDWIYHIEDLQKRRALENWIRYTHSDEGVKQRIKEIKANETYDADEAQDMINAILDEANNPLSGLVRELMNRTNTLANKKSSMDRGMEDATNRKIYSTMTNLNNRINANMVVGSVSSALTNFIPMVQSWHQVSPYFTVRGLGDYVRSVVRDDGMVEKSDFLTNRLVDEEKLYQTGWDKVSDKAGWMMSLFDGITSQTVWRSKYLQNLKEGMSESAAIKDADQFAKNLMAGRSRGNAPTIFDAKNPLIKIATAFQLEVANQYGFMFEDTPQDTKSKARLVKGYATAFMGAYLYNALYSSLVGRDAAFDPISIIEDLLKGLFDDEEEPEDVILDTGKDILEEVPYIGGLLGGGRIPISSALPYSSDSTPFKSMLTDVTDGNWDSFGKEFLKPLYYLAMPVGGGQLKKTIEGLSMFDDDLPISGSYTDSGKLRFPVEKNFGNMLQAGLFGQYASENARTYFDEGYSPMGEGQIQEFLDVDIPIRDYWEYRKGLQGLGTIGEKADYINDMDIPIDKKNLLINNATGREEPIDMTDYDDFGSFEEFDWAQKNPEKYAISRAITPYWGEYLEYTDTLNNIRADKDANGKTINGSAKAKKMAYIESLNIDYGAKLILHKSQYKSDDAYNRDIIEYLYSRTDLTDEDRVTILKELGFTVKADGIYWD